MCAEQGIALRGHTEQYSSNDAGKNSDTERTIQRGNFLAITNAFATLDTVLMEYLKKVLKTPRWYHGIFKMTYLNFYLSLYGQK